MITHKTKRRKLVTQPGGTLVPKPSPFEEYMMNHWKSLPQESNLTTPQVRDIFSHIMNEMGLTINSLRVGVSRARIQAEVLFDAQRNVTLNYDDYYFNTLTEDEIKAILTHESCHIATLPDSRILAPTPDSPHAAFIEIFDEYLVHNEFARRFTGTKRFDVYKDFKTRDLQNYETILTLARAEQMDIMKALYTILNDAVYFPIVGDHRFAEWCHKKKLTDLPRFLDWLIEDFKFIENLKLNRMETMESLSIEGILSSTVNYYLLLGDSSRDNSLFTPTAEVIEEICSRKSKTPLIEVWRDRRMAESQ